MQSVIVEPELNLWRERDTRAWVTEPSERPQLAWGEQGIQQRHRRGQAGAGVSQSTAGTSATASSVSTAATAMRRFREAHEQAKVAKKRR